MKIPPFGGDRTTPTLMKAHHLSEMLRSPKCLVLWRMRVPLHKGFFFGDGFFHRSASKLDKLASGTSLAGVENAEHRTYNELYIH